MPKAKTKPNQLLSAARRNLAIKLEIARKYSELRMMQVIESIQRLSKRTEASDYNDAKREEEIALKNPAIESVVNRKVQAEQQWALYNELEKIIFHEKVVIESFFLHEMELQKFLEEMRFIQEHEKWLEEQKHMIEKMNEFDENIITHEAALEEMALLEKLEKILDHHIEIYTQMLGVIDEQIKQLEKEIEELNEQIEEAMASIRENVQEAFTDLRTGGVTRVGLDWSEKAMDEFNERGATPPDHMDVHHDHIIDEIERDVLVRAERGDRDLTVTRKDENKAIKVVIDRGLQSIREEILAGVDSVVEARQGSVKECGANMRPALGRFDQDKLNRIHSEYIEKVENIAKEVINIESQKQAAEISRNMIKNDLINFSSTKIEVDLIRDNFTQSQSNQENSAALFKQIDMKLDQIAGQGKVTLPTEYQSGQGSFKMAASKEPIQLNEPSTKGIQAVLSKHKTFKNDVLSADEEDLFSNDKPADSKNSTQPKTPEDNNTGLDKPNHKITFTKP